MNGQHIGYGGTNQWKVWIPERNEVVTSRDVVFDEEEGEKLMTEVPAASAVKPVIHPEIRVLPGPPEPKESPPASEASEASEDEEPQQPAKSAAKKRPAPPPPSRVSERPGKGQHAPRFGETVAKLAQTSNPDDEEEPTTFREATTHPTRAKEWTNTTRLCGTTPGDWFPGRQIDKLSPANGSLNTRRTNLAELLASKPDSLQGDFPKCMGSIIATPMPQSQS